MHGRSGLGLEQTHQIVDNNDETFGITKNFRCYTHCNFNKKLKLIFFTILAVKHRSLLHMLHELLARLYKMEMM